MKNGESVIEVRGMTKRFGELTAVDHVDLTVAAGEIYGFLGPNGSGKTTFLRMLCGLLRADDGSGRVLGHDVLAESEAIKREVGYMTQRFSFWEDLSIEENLDFVARMYELKNRRQTVRESIEQLGLAERKDQTRRRTFGRMEAASRAGGLPHSSPEIVVIGRADSGRRSKSAPRFLGADSSTRRPGTDVPHHHSLHG